MTIIELPQNFLFKKEEQESGKKSELMNVVNDFFKNSETVSVLGELRLAESFTESLNSLGFKTRVIGIGLTPEFSTKDSLIIMLNPADELMLEIYPVIQFYFLKVVKRNTPRVLLITQKSFAPHIERLSDIVIPLGEFNDILNVLDILFELLEQESLLI